jgi:hypothetical protein
LTRMVPGDEVGVEYKITITLRAGNRHALADAINAAIRAGQRDLIVGSAVFYLYAVQGHDRIIGPGAVNLYSVEMKYVFRLKQTI